MEAKLTQVGEVIVVSINGRLDIDQAKPFYDACLKNLLDKKVVFNLQSLNFVGSTGIQHFFQLIRDVNAKNKYGLRVSGMTADFQRVWCLSENLGVSIHENTQSAVQSFMLPMASVQADFMPSEEVVQLPVGLGSGTRIS